jgi:hypothetical protein
MNKYQAEKIINAYGGAIANNKNVFKKQSILPCSKAKIRYAFYVYIQAIIDQLGHLPKDIGENLVSTYCMLDAFVPDEDADRLNKISEKIKSRELIAENPEDKKQIEEYFSLATNALRNGYYFDEINNYIGEYYKEKGIK